MPKKVLFAASIAFAIAFLLFSQIAEKPRLAKLDFDLTVKLQDKVPVVLDPLLELSAFIADFEIALIVLTIIVIAKRKILAFVALPLFLLVHFIELYGKVFINHPGPPVMFLRAQTITFFPKWQILSDSSYPSGHAMRAIFIALVAAWAILLYKQNKWAKNIFPLVIWIWAILTIISRVALGQHWTSDVLGGSLLGASFGFFALLFF